MKWQGFIGRVTSVALLLLPACQPDGLAAPQCGSDEGSNGVGEWSHVSLPQGILLPGDPATSDGENLVVGHDRCSSCQIGVLEAGSGTWTLAEYMPAMTGPHAYIAGRQQIVAIGSPTEIIDRETWISTSVEPPSTLRGVEHMHWPGERVVLWGGKDTEDPDLTPREIAQNPDTPWLWFYEGHLLDPSTGDWTVIPPAREDARYLMSQGGPDLESVWTPGGLFVWGTNPEQTERWGAIFDVESMSWEILEIGEDAPPLVRNHRMLSLGDDVYVFAGVTPGNDSAWRRLWKYSVVTRSWEEIDVPTWADPLLGAVVNGRLAFTGRCPGGDLYDPATDTWKPLSAEGGPPSSGIPRGAGSFLTITDTYYGEQETNQVWILDLREELGG